MTVLMSPPTAIPRCVVQDRGTWAMYLFIASEAMLFVSLFFAYYYLGHDEPSWPPEPPQYRLALVMLGVLAASSIVLHVGERAERAGRVGRARALVGGTAGLGLLFVALQVLEYREHLKTLRPATNAYGSIFYVITSVHGLHLLLGLSMLGYVLLLPEFGAAQRPPHGALHNAALYWHFVDVVWVVIVALVYLAPNMAR
ncbi:MAG: cytochrome c oxidase subunit 3 [Vicinamibacterales bacterium]